MALDTFRGKVVLFGGISNGSVLDDLWELDVAQNTWLNLTPTPRPSAWPPPRFGHSMAFDATRKKIVVFGTPSGSNMFDDVWEWDTQAGKWTLVTTALRPTRRAFSTLVAEPTGRVLLFGGSGVGGVLPELWAWTGASATWQNLTPITLPATWPSARDSHGAAYESTTQKMIVFGGKNDLMNKQWDDLWEWDSTSQSWTSRTPTPRPVSWPAGRDSLAAAYVDAPTGMFVIYGGIIDVPGPGTIAEIWAFDPLNGNWIDRTVTPLPSNWPSARVLSVMIYDQAIGALLMFGGSGFAGDDNDLWRLGSPAF